jgi:hypothetical protein
VPEVLAHLGRAGRAVQPEDVDAERLERRERRADLAAEQHRAGRLDRHLAHQRHVGARRRDRALRADDRRLGLQEVLGGLDEHCVHATGEHPAHLRLVRVAQRGVGDVTQRRQLGARPDRADHPARLPRGGPLVCDLAGDPRPGFGELLDPALDAVLREVAEVRPEGVGLDRVHTGVVVGLVDRADDVGSCDVEDLVAALVTLEVVQAGVLGLQHRAHGAVGDDDPLGEGLAERDRAVRHAIGGGHRGESTGAHTS